jgi:hypothetical protein
VDEPVAFCDACGWDPIGPDAYYNNAKLHAETCSPAYVLTGGAAEARLLLAERFPNLL